MTLSDRASNLRARKQAEDGPTAQHASSSDGSPRPALRLITGTTQVAEPTPEPIEDHSASTHLADAAGRVDTHPATSTHPPTVADAIAGLWPAPEDVRYGLPGQLASALAGLAQTLGLLALWGAAHVFFATKTRAAISALFLIGGFAALVIASHA